jgi:hypothetical protein
LQEVTKTTFTSGRLTIQIQEKSFSTIGTGVYVVVAQTSAQKISQTLVSDVADMTSNLANVISNQVTTFDPLLNHMGVFVKIGDEVAKV